MYNKAILMGRICNDLELKTTPSGANVLSFRIAVDRSYQVKGEERKSDFFNIVAWRATADFISRFFSKGRMILVEGELQTRQYVDKNGSTQTVVELVVDNARFTGEPKPQNGGYPAGGYSASSYQPPQPVQHPAEQSNAAPMASNGSYTANDFAATTETDDDYPF